MLVPINTVEDPETFKWEGVVDFDNGGRQAKLVAASHNAVVTVIPPGLEGEITLRVRGPEGRSNPVRINVDQSCSSNRGKEITEAQAREWADQVPEDLIERATDRTGQFINFEPGEILVQFEGAPGELEDLKSKYNIRSWERIPGTDFSVVRLEDRGIRNTLETADALSTEDRVRYAVENGLMTLLQAELNDPNIDQQEQLRATNMFTGWRAFFLPRARG
ncbi:MAG: S8 family serine peptidase [Candidatus Bipolaricaulota bacterium]